MNLAVIEQEVIEACLETGAFIHEESLRFDRSRIEQKEGFNNLVSYVDKESERRLVAALGKIVPGSGFLAEEGTSTKGTNAYRWIIDPLDGTTNFTHGLAPFAISVALADETETVLGVVYEVNARECFHSRKGAPAFLNGRQIKVSTIKTMSESLFATGFPYHQLDKMDAYMNIIHTFLDKSHGIRRLGSAATDLAYVACGRLEGFFEYNLSPWDVAAGGFIVQQAGGIVTDFRGGNNFLHGGELVAGCGVHPAMLEVIRPAWGY
ncbi:MAG: inositol monophosphatase [Cyclobacteriaceae bacterium]|nr:inositol monophosphatase [Cyclobacteriaceae bacterium]